MAVTMIVSLVALVSGAALVLFASMTQVLVANPSNAFNWINTVSMYSGIVLTIGGLVAVLAQVAVA